MQYSFSHAAKKLGGLFPNSENLDITIIIIIIILISHHLIFRSLYCLTQTIDPADSLPSHSVNINKSLSVEKLFGFKSILLYYPSAIISSMKY